jgi:hypothetical protein
MNCRIVNPLTLDDRASLAAALGAFLFGASICGWTPQALSATEPIWPTREWRTSSPEEQGMDPKELVKLVDFGRTGSLDSLLVVRHGNPELDVVAVTTGRDNHPFSQLADYILNSVKSDTALTLDQASANLLANKILDVSAEQATAVGATSEIAAIVSGRVYRFPPNAISIKSLSLILTDPKPRYDMETYTEDETKSAPRLAGPIGLDGLYRKSDPTYLQELAICGVNAVKGTWRDDHTFVIDRLILGEGQPATQWTLTFEEDRLNVRTTLGDGQEISVDSQPGS